MEEGVSAPASAPAPTEPSGARFLLLHHRHLHAKAAQFCSCILLIKTSYEFIVSLKCKWGSIRWGNGSYVIIITFHFLIFPISSVMKKLPAQLSDYFGCCEHNCIKNSIDTGPCTFIELIHFKTPKPNSAHRFVRIFAKHGVLSPTLHIHLYWGEIVHVGMCIPDNLYRIVYRPISYKANKQITGTGRYSLFQQISALRTIS